MIMLDTDILSLALSNHPRVSERMRAAAEFPVISIIARIEVLQGRFDALIKAADEKHLLIAQERLRIVELQLAEYFVVPCDAPAGAEFARLRQDKRLKRIGRRDMLIACVALANRAKLVTRNTKDFQMVTGLRLENWAD